MDEYIKRMKVFLLTYKIPKMAKHTKHQGMAKKKNPRCKTIKIKLN